MSAWTDERLDGLGARAVALHKTHKSSTYDTSLHGLLRDDVPALITAYRDLAAAALVVVASDQESSFNVGIELSTGTTIYALVERHVMDALTAIVLPQEARSGDA